jgi:succinate dehydrogenase/fumarate reductase-like Fe-S protein
VGDLTSGIGVTHQVREYVTVYFNGEAYRVPKGLTIMKALEYAGFRFTRGAGCRGGFCGACPVVYRLPGDYKIRVGLACQTAVVDGMYISLVPYVPLVEYVPKRGELRPDPGYVLKLYPEISRCVSCNACSKACPQGLSPMDAIQAILRGDLKKAAELTFDCISCGLCSLRCPAEIRHPPVFRLVGRIVGLYYTPRSKSLEERVREIESGKYGKVFEKLLSTPTSEVRRVYEEFLKTGRLPQSLEVG